MDILADTSIRIPAELDHDECWQAVLARDSQYDGQFVTAVRTTGIFCRPSCPARTPKRQNVTFYTTCAEAEAAGFRACKRCTPTEAHPQADLAQRVARYIEAHLDDDLTLETLGAALHTSPFHLQRIFKRAMGISPRDYAEALRAERLRVSLREGSSVTSAIYDAGYNTSSRVYERDVLGMTPRSYRNGGQAAQIRYTITPTLFGLVLIAATDKGICAVRLGDDAASLEAILTAEFPAAEITQAGADEGAALNTYITEILARIEGAAPRMDLPLDIRATAFQQRVWLELRAIPRGETRSYSQIARQIGSPKATRAVARACASNPVALVIPCHRVVREDGELGGYRWGIERKQAILAREAVGE